MAEKKPNFFLIYILAARGASIWQNMLGKPTGNMHFVFFFQKIWTFLLLPALPPGPIS